MPRVRKILVARVHLFGGGRTRSEDFLFWVDFAQQRQQQ